MPNQAARRKPRVASYDLAQSSRLAQYAILLHALSSTPWFGDAHQPFASARGIKIVSNPHNARRTLGKYTFDNSPALTMNLNLPQYHKSFAVIIILFHLTTTTLQVDVGILFSPVSRRPYQIWTNVPPGRCCTPTPSIFAHAEVPSARDGYALSATVAHLQAFDIAFAWAEQFTPNGVRAVQNPGCTTRPWQTRRGPGSHIIRDDDDIPQGDFHWIVGVSYIRLPEGLPTSDDKKESLWLNVQGISRLSLGGGKWLPDGVSIPFGWKSKREQKKNEKKNRILDRYTGTVEWRSPGFFKYPDIIEVEGVNYTDGWRGDLVYMSSEGKTLNLTTFEPF
ncbi:MAG: hypothetical protein Q9222_007633 [Ikaeria aurantiellina]